MRIKDNGSNVTIWVSAKDTYEWANEINNVWPCSELSGHRFVATFDSNGLLDLTVNGKEGSGIPNSGYIPVDEFNACCADMLKDRIDKDHPCYFITIGQFSEK
jgi:hypothetical protein